MSANDNSDALDFIKAVDRAIDLIITDFVCTVSIGADGVCVRAALPPPDSFDGMPIILGGGVRTEINGIRLPQDNAAPSHEPIGGGGSQLCLFSCLSSHAST